MLEILNDLHLQQPMLDKPERLSTASSGSAKYPVRPYDLDDSLACDFSHEKGSLQKGMLSWKGRQAIVPSASSRRTGLREE